MYLSKLENFNNHEWVRFYEDEEGEPNIQWAEGCHDVGIDGLDSFEKRVVERYGGNRNGTTYRTYMLESDKMRLALILPARTNGNVIVHNFKTLLCDTESQAREWIDKADVKDYYYSKNMMWLFRTMTAKPQDYKYLESCDNENGDYYYYDLVTVEYLNENFAIPVPVLSKILQVSEETIYKCFEEHFSRDEIKYI